jgi:hypothetical protein
MSFSLPRKNTLRINDTNLVEEIEDIQIWGNGHGGGGRRKSTGFAVPAPFTKGYGDAFILSSHSLLLRWSPADDEY